ncbi:helix-turn-helix domain-containing protein [Microlunatus sp. GCM10028923]|uniref:MmyB family transcriptional regulator n=1 Tax=Microlunatus sp. GCM10028923 TaxID=3273400 RepID=UPI00360F57B4
MTQTVGWLLREWRHRRGLSQLDLALAADVSARHVSLVETGRSNPSADMVLRLAAELEVPLRDRNRLLVAAGYAPRYRQRPLAGPALAAARDAVTRVLTAHEPYPAIVFDRHWNIVTTNETAAAVLAAAVDPSAAAPANMVRLALTPGELRSRIVNFPEVRAFFRSRLSRQLARTGDPAIEALYQEFFAESAAEDLPAAEFDVVIPMIIRYAGHELQLFSTITTFGTPQDITLDEISVESYYPADDRTAATLRSLAETRRPTGVDHERAGD